MIRGIARRISTLVLALSLTAVGLAASLAGSPVVEASCYGSGCFNVQPGAGGCISGDYVAVDTITSLAETRILYSSNCNSEWVDAFANNCCDHIYTDAFQDSVYDCSSHTGSTTNLTEDFSTNYQESLMVDGSHVDCGEFWFWSGSSTYLGYQHPYPSY